MAEAYNRKQEAKLKRLGLKLCGSSHIYFIFKCNLFTQVYPMYMFGYYSPIKSYFIYTFMHLNGFSYLILSFSILFLIFFQDFFARGLIYATKNRNI